MRERAVRRQSSSWTSAGQPLTPPSSPRSATERTDRELLGQIAKDVSTIATIVVISFWLSVIAGVVIVWASYASSP